MIKFVLKQVDYTSSSTVQRDLQSLEDSVNAFIRNSNIIPVGDVTFQEYTIGGNNYLIVLVPYDLKKP